MSTRAKRVFFYLTLALICYVVALTLGSGAAAVVFFVAGGFGELLFWMEVFRASRR